MLTNNWLALFVTLIAALSWLRLVDFAAHRGWIGSQLSRKIIHIGTGPIFVLCWLLFKEDVAARYLAALVPLGITAQFALVGLGVVQDPAAVQAMSRSGDRREVLKGPLYYGIIFVLVTVFYWRVTPIGIVALMLLCGGDGLADIVGRRWGVRRLPWNSHKSWTGSLGFFFGGWLTAAAVLAVYVAVGAFPAPLAAYLLPLTLVVLAGTLVESLPTPDLDNLTVSAAALLVGHLLF